MINLKILKKSEKREIENQLKGRFGIQEIPGTLIMKGKERLFLFSGNFDKKEIRKLENILWIERIGVYFAKFVDGTVKLSIEGVHFLKSQIKKNIFELEETQVEDWMKGQDLQIKTGKKGFLAMKYKDDFFGTGKASEEKIGNFIPKSRRLKNRSS